MTLTRGTMLLLVAVHGFLLLWALVGWLEFFWASPPWPRISNPRFPAPVLALQWGLVLVASLVFLAGYALRWPYTPVALACTYAAMAALCAVETFQYLDGRYRFVAMGVEYLAYAAILIFLFRSRVFEAG